MTQTLTQSAGENMLVGITLVLFFLALVGSMAFWWFVELSSKTDKLDGSLQDGKAIAYIFFRVYAGLVIVCVLLGGLAMTLGLRIQV